MSGQTFIFADMDIVRDELTRLGFHRTLVGNENWPDHLYTFTYELPRWGRKTIKVWSKSNWMFEITIQFSGAETGVEGYGEYRAFKGHISSEDSLHILKILLESTGVWNDLKYKNIASEI